MIRLCGRTGGFLKDGGMADVVAELDDQRGGGKRYCRDYT